MAVAVAQAALLAGAAGYRRAPQQSARQQLADSVLLAPFDAVVFERTWKDADLTLVAASQAAVDLLTSPGRAPSEAEAILKQLAWTES